MTGEEEIAAAADGFYAALNVMFEGDAGPMLAVWSHADDVTYMGPDGSYKTGWAAIRAEWEMQAAKKLGGRVDPTEMRITVAGDLGVTHNYEQGENANTGDKPGAVSIRATNIFRKENGAWKMIGHHTDMLPFLA